MYLIQNTTHDNREPFRTPLDDGSRTELPEDPPPAVDAPSSAAPPRPKLLNFKDELSLVWRWQRRKDHRARDALVRAFQPAIRNFASNYRGGGLDLDDRISLGNIGFLTALDKFDIHRRLRLWTYARQWVRAEISSATERCRSIVARPRKRGEKSGKILADLSLSAPAGENGELADFLFDDYPDHEPRHFNNDALSSALGFLTPRQRTIFTARRLSDRPAVLSSLAAEFQLSSERIRQIECDALAIVSAAMKKAEGRASPQFAQQMTAEVFRGRGHKLSYSYHRWPDFRDCRPRGAT